MVAVGGQSQQTRNKVFLTKFKVTWQFLLSLNCIWIRIWIRFCIEKHGWIWIQTKNECGSTVLHVG